MIFIGQLQDVPRGETKEVEEKGEAVRHDPAAEEEQEEEKAGTEK